MSTAMSEGLAKELEIFRLGKDGYLATLAQAESFQEFISISNKETVVGDVRNACVVWPRGARVLDAPDSDAATRVWPLSSKVF